MIAIYYIFLCLPFYLTIVIKNANCGYSGYSSNYNNNALIGPLTLRDGESVYRFKEQTSKPKRSKLCDVYRGGKLYKRPCAKKTIKNTDQSSNIGSNKSSNTELINQSCMECICRVSSGCDLNKKCEVDVCGPYLISFGYWSDGGKPGNDFDACATDKACAERAVRTYMQRYKKDCNGDGKIDCADFAAIHKLGPFSCNSDPSFFTSFTCNARSLPQLQKNDRIDATPCQTKEGSEGYCQTVSYCFSQYNDLDEISDNSCKLTDKNTGVCCPKQVRPVPEKYLPIRIPHPYSASANIRHISLDEINTVAEEAQQFIKKFFQKERRLISSGYFQRHGSSQAQHQAFFGKFDRTQFMLTKGGFINLVTTIKIKEKFKLTNNEARDGLLKYSLAHTDLEQYCIREPVCKQSKYRTADGSCNNLQKPLWGKSNTPFTRLVLPQYSDGLDKPRVSVTGRPLPGARSVSVAAAVEHDLNDKKFTLFVMQWGQIIDHDLTLTASTRAASGEGLICCRDGLKENVRHPSCFPIPIPADDPFYSRHSQSCMDFVRNAPSPREGCTLGHREQMNTLTHYIDGSMVYGSTNDLMKHLRSFKHGALRTNLVNNLEFLPFDTENRSEECAIPERDRQTHHCFVGGDVRVNEQTGLTMAHNLLLREHNRVAKTLLSLNPKWSDEIVYQESRRIVAAEIQHITYNEWMPLILGRTVMKEFNILPQPYGFTTTYDPTINPSIINSFATAAYRFHTLIQGIILLMNNRGDVTTRLQLRDLFNNPTSIYPLGAFDEYLNGYTAEPTQTFDKFFTRELTNHLFQEHGHSFGMDLISLNLQRGREHGLPGYNEYRKVCGLETINSFEQLNDVMQKGSAQTFAKLYSSVDDIDLFIAGNHEKRLPDAVVGPTFACILAEQSRRGKLGDRFWYENGELPHSFTEEQLLEIRRSSLARLICDNSDNIERMQPLAFLQPIGWNKRIDCSNIGSVNLNLWKGERIWNQIENKYNYKKRPKLENFD